MQTAPVRTSPRFCSRRANESAADPPYTVNLRGVCERLVIPQMVNRSEPASKAITKKS